MASNHTITIITITIVLFLSHKPNLTASQPSWVQSGYWSSVSDLPVGDIDSGLFTHLICAFAYINSSSYQLYINSSKEQSFSQFTDTIKLKNRSVKSILSIRAGKRNSPVFASMVDNSSYRTSFIESSIRLARLYRFEGIDIFGVDLNPITNMTKLGILLDEFRTAVDSESRNSGKSQLILVMSGFYLPSSGSVTYPIESIKRNLNWVHVISFDYYLPTKENITGLHAALYGDPNRATTDKGIKEWLKIGLPPSNLVLGLPYHGYNWRLVNPNGDGIDAPASGPAITIDGSYGYKAIQSFIRNYGYGANEVYNSTYVVNLFRVGVTWFNFDGVEAIKAKVAYAKEKNLLGYSAFQIANDDNWILSRAAHGKEGDELHKGQLLVPILVSVSVFILLVCTGTWCYVRRKLIFSNEIIGSLRKTVSRHITTDGTNLRVFNMDIIQAATNDFSSENKLGEGGFGPVYKGLLPTGQQIAVKRLSHTSNQGAEEFQNEVSLTARLQHVNLVRVIGFCTEREEKMLVYEYMPNKSLDSYLFDPLRRHVLDWHKRVHIIEGVTQGLLYLQEYSNFTVIHRDIKASNILLDKDLNPKISDFGMARLFRKDELEANTRRIVGTYGYVPPEYVRKGIYSMKYDVYSFGVLLLQIISSKRNTRLYGPHENLNILEYAYDLWREGEGKEFIDPILDDSCSSCTLMTCLQVALLCVQENSVYRPSMLEVSVMLKNGSNATIATPKRPAFSTKAGQEEKEEDYSLKNNVYSVDDDTITVMLPR